LRSEARKPEETVPIIDTLNEEARNSKGIHLYHFWMSSCSQRVRIVLAEKNLQWVDHVVDISPQGLQHATDEYQSIHPEGLVPALVHEGRVIIESIDIIDYLDEEFPDPPLRSGSEAGRREMSEWMRRASGAQHSLKTLTHEFLFKPRRMAPDQLRDFIENHHNEELCDFMRTFCSEEGFPRSEIESEVQHQLDEFLALDRALENQEWLVENTFSLADIAWLPNVRRFDIMSYPLDRHPNLLGWYERFKQRPSYHKGVADSEVQPALAHFKEYGDQRAAEGTGIATFGSVAGSVE